VTRSGNPITSVMPSGWRAAVSSVRLVQNPAAVAFWPRTPRAATRLSWRARC
jgi:hypothetical protein